MSNTVFCFLKTQTLVRTTKNQISTNFLNHVKPGSKSSLFQTGAFSPHHSSNSGTGTKHQWLHAGEGHNAKISHRARVVRNMMGPESGGNEGVLGMKTHGK